MAQNQNFITTKLGYVSAIQLQIFFCFLIETFLYFLKFLLETYIIFKVEKKILKIKIRVYSN